jgi:hypothetical protein
MATEDGGLLSIPCSPLTQDIPTIGLEAALQLKGVELMHGASAPATNKFSTC